MHNPHLPCDAIIVDRIQEAPTLFTLQLRFTDAQIQERYRFEPGQFNMLYLPGVGEIPISIVSDPQHGDYLSHTIRSVGRVTRGLEKLKIGDHIGIRGPYGRGWPMTEAEGKDVVLVTGGLGCAPLVAEINYILRRRERFGRLNIVQGVKHTDDLIWRERYEAWRQTPDTVVLLTADQGSPLWPWHIGPVTRLFDQLLFAPERTIVMVCGPEGMMRAVIEQLLPYGICAHDIWLSMERNMPCGVGHCGHCQIGGKFTCKDGPVFRYTDIQQYLGLQGY